ncbi:MAG: surface-adhesin E family protein [Pyrinomonadaceae bacterium]
MYKRSFLVFWLAVILVLPVETLFASGASQNDDDWQFVGTSREGVKLYHSPDRTVEREKLIQAWFKGIHPDSDKKISHYISLYEFNCRKGTYRLLQGTLYFRDGSARSSNQESAWERPLPNSVAEMEFRQVCRPKTSRRKDVKP